MTINSSVLRKTQAQSGNNVYIAVSRYVYLAITTFIIPAIDVGR
jgi:hypothetical protein